MTSFKFTRQSFCPTPGWKVLHNEFYSVDLAEKIYPEGSEDMPSWSLFSSTLLQLVYDKKNLLIDLGWLPESDPEGSFCLTLLRADDEQWENPLTEFSSRDKDIIVEKLNEVMRAVSKGEIQ